MPKGFDGKFEHFEIPDAVIKTLSECTGGNFILFSVDDCGEPTCVAEFQNSIMEIGLRSYITQFVGSINNAEGIQGTQSLLESDTPPEDYEDDEEF